MNSLTSSPLENLAESLHALYHDASKHSVYQSVPAFVARSLGYQEEIHSLWRSDAPRYDFLINRLQLPSGASVADIGANTGFFTLNLAHSRPDLRITAYEMNPKHAEFIRLTATAFGLDGVNVRSQSCDFAGLAGLPRFDAILLLNVLHHAGFDFDRDVSDDNAAFHRYAVSYLTRLRQCARRLVFQVGSNRGGDKARPLFHRDDDLARLRWVADVLVAAGWRMSTVGYAQLDGAAGVVFEDLPAALTDQAARGCIGPDGFEDYFRAAQLARFPGEFHRRPLVIASALDTIA